MDTNSLIPSHYCRDIDAILEYHRKYVRRDDLDSALKVWYLLDDLEFKGSDRYLQASKLIPYIERMKVHSNLEMCEHPKGTKRHEVYAKIYPKFALGTSQHFAIEPSHAITNRHIRNLLRTSNLDFELHSVAIYDKDSTTVIHVGRDTAPYPKYPKDLIKLIEPFFGYTYTPKLNWGDSSVFMPDKYYVHAGTYFHPILRHIIVITSVDRGWNPNRYTCYHAEGEVRHA